MTWYLPLLIVSHSRFSLPRSGRGDWGVSSPGVPIPPLSEIRPALLCKMFSVQRHWKQIGHSRANLSQLVPTGKIWALPLEVNSFRGPRRGFRGIVNGCVLPSLNG